ncbi:hypothetical protein GHT09_010123 [Marmota monax]|uniref:Uncharacterized protein n=1 Tax=Marmota monax TaxID=9995 RepID=A0A834PNI3_MARMO|nr:hypothetical protein GHT09_010123 [Marmota monax]
MGPERVLGGGWPQPAAIAVPGDVLVLRPRAHSWLLPGWECPPLEPSLHLAGSGWPASSRKQMPLTLPTGREPCCPASPGTRHLPSRGPALARCTRPGLLLWSRDGILRPPLAHAGSPATVPLCPGGRVTSVSTAVLWRAGSWLPLSWPGLCSESPRQEALGKSPLDDSTVEMKCAKEADLASCQRRRLGNPTRFPGWPGPGLRFLPAFAGRVRSQRPWLPGPLSPAVPAACFCLLRLCPEPPREAQSWVPGGALPLHVLGYEADRRPLRKQRNPQADERGANHHADGRSDKVSTGTEAAGSPTAALQMGKLTTRATVTPRDPEERTEVDCGGRLAAQPPGEGQPPSFDNSVSCHVLHVTAWDPLPSSFLATKLPLMEPLARQTEHGKRQHAGDATLDTDPPGGGYICPAPLGHPSTCDHEESASSGAPDLDPLKSEEMDMNVQGLQEPQ